VENTEDDTDCLTPLGWLSWQWQVQVRLNNVFSQGEGGVKSDSKSWMLEEEVKEGNLLFSNG